MRLTTGIPTGFIDLCKCLDFIDQTSLVLPPFLLSFELHWCFLCGETAPHWALYLPPQGHLGSISLPSPLPQGKYSIKLRTALLVSYSIHADREPWGLCYIKWLILPLIPRSACSWWNMWLFQQHGDIQIIKCSLRPNKQQPQQSSLKKKKKKQERNDHFARIC